MLKIDARDAGAAVVERSRHLDLRLHLLQVQLFHLGAGFDDLQIFPRYDFEGHKGDQSLNEWEWYEDGPQRAKSQSLVAVLQGLDQVWPADVEGWDIDKSYCDDGMVVVQTLANRAFKVWLMEDRIVLLGFLLWLLPEVCKNAGHSVAIQQQISAHSAAAQEQNNLSIASPGDDDNNDSNNSSIQSNSNSEFSDINDSHGGGGHGPTICQVATVRQRSANTPTPKRNYNQVSWGVSKPSLGGKKNKFKVHVFIRRPQKVTKSSLSIWQLLHAVKLTVKIFSIFVAFSENVNFKKMFDKKLKFE